MGLAGLLRGGPVRSDSQNRTPEALGQGPEERFCNVF
jgi:hypothetical protein